MPFHNFIRDGAGWRTLAETTVFANPYLEVRQASLCSPSRPEPFSWTITHRKAAVVVVPMTSQGAFVLVRQERAPIRDTIWEFPAGQIDHETDHDEAAIRQAGLRELTEESGFELDRGGDVLSLGFFFPSAGFTDEHSHLLLARPVVPAASGHQPDSSEAIVACREFTSAELQSSIASGEIRDANTLAAFARLVAIGIIAVPNAALE